MKKKTAIEELVDNSISAALSSIEIYNKPDFRYREEIFSILNINAWELLLKAKILKDSGGKIESIYAMQGGSPKLNRNGTPMTIEMFGAIARVGLDLAVTENLKALIDVRDNAIHFYNNSAVRYLVFTLGVASLKNYQKLTKDWFGRSLSDYNFYILPLAFAYDFKTLSILELEKQPPGISALIKNVSQKQASLNEAAGFYFVCEISTELITAKKFSEDADIVVNVGKATDSKIPVITKTQRLIDKYQLSYKELIEKVQKELPSGQDRINKLIAKTNLKFDSRFSAFNFRSKIQEEKFKRTHLMPKGVPSLYNDDAVRFIVEQLKKPE